MDIFDIFRAAANPEKAAPMAAYMRDQFVFLGIPKPERKILSRDFLKTAAGHKPRDAAGKTSPVKKPVDWKFVFTCWEQPEREFQHLALEYLLKFGTLLSPGDIPNIRKLIVAKSWWDTIDYLDSIVGGIALRYPEINDLLLEWSVDENFWLRRIAIDHQLGRKEKTDAALLERILINNLGQTEFFINKAIGWSLREYSKTNPDWVRAFIAKHRERMAPLSIREASKYI